jgi:hypothetical protein
VRPPETRAASKARSPQPAAQGGEQAGEDAAAQAADQADEGRGEPRGAGGAAVKLPEVGVVALQRIGGEARHHHHKDDRHVGAPVEGARQFLQGEDHAGDRGVEGRRDARGAAGDDHRAPAGTAAQAPGQGADDAGQHLHGRPLPPDRGPARQQGGGQNHLDGRRAQGDALPPPAAAPSVFGRGDHLGYAAAGGFRRESLGEPGRERQPDRQQEQGRPRGGGQPAGVHRHRRVAQAREHRRRQTAQDGDGDDDAGAPQDAQAQADAQTFPPAGGGVGGKRKGQAHPPRMPQGGDGRQSEPERTSVGPKSGIDGGLTIY